MFTDFFYTLKERKVPVSITEWMALMEALSKGYISNLDEFYYLARAILVKSETLYDNYDVAFQEYFTGIKGPPEITEQLLEWLKDPINRSLPTQLEMLMATGMDFEELLQTFEDRLREQRRRHDGGDIMIGTGGTSAFGHSGYNSAGVRIGGPGGGRSAVQIAEARKFRNYRSDLALDVRQIQMALKALRNLGRTGPEDELDLDATIDLTCKNAGDIELVWRRRRKNNLKLLLLMDAGGSMEPYARLCSLLFSAANSAAHFKDFKYFYFHNCVYDKVYTNIESRESVSTSHLLRTLEPDYKLVMVGDACMATTELMERDGAIYYYQRNETPGIVWLKRISDHFSHRVWLNPMELPYWNHPTVLRVKKLFHMFELTLDGLNQAVKKLVVKK